MSLFHRDSGLVLTLGKALTYDAECVQISLDCRSENNVLICGHDLQMKRYFLIELILSSDGCNDCEELIYIGDNVPELLSKYTSKKFISMSCITEFINKFQDDFFNKRRIIIIDNIDMNREIGFPPSFGQPAPLLKSFMDFWADANKHGSHIIAFYDGMSRIKASKLPTDSFIYRIGYALNSDEKNQLLGNTAYSNSAPERQRAFLANNLVIDAWFRPYEF